MFVDYTMLKLVLSSLGCYMSWIKNQWLLQIVILAAIFIWKDAVPQITTELHSGLTLSPVPWVGVLLVKPSQNATESVAGVVLICKKMAIVNARDLAKINGLQWAKVRNGTRVMFLTTENQPWYAKVTNFTIHSEFDDTTLATIGVLNLEYDDRNLLDEMLSWPNGINNVSYAGDEIFVFGYTEQSGKLEQIVYRMDYVKFDECVQFYIDEKLDSQWMRPIKYHCYRVRYKKDSCVFEPGMALVHHFKGIWTLLGMSTLGPGCSLPARFLDFEYFMPWIASKLQARRSYLPITFKWFVDYWMNYENRETKDLDAWMLARLNDTKIVLTKITLQAVGQKLAPETVSGSCDSNNMEDKQFMYRDRIEFTSQAKDHIGMGVYGLSLYDHRFNSYTCISVLAVCSHKSNIKLWYTSGFEQGHPYDNLIKKAPLKYDKQYLRHHHYLEELSWMDYNFEILGSDITNLLFRFQYKYEGYLEIRFYGKKTEQYETSAETTTKIDYLKYHRSSVGFKSWKMRLVSRPTIKPTKRTITTTNWWNRWWKYQGYPKIPDEDGEDTDWFQGLN